MSEYLTMPADLSSVEQGDVFTMGAWADEPLAWRVLEVADGKALVVSDKAILRRSFHRDYGDITWDKCSLRKFLNSDFKDEAFSEEEGARIQLSTIENPNGKGKRTQGCDDTQDYLFCLSAPEAAKYFDGDADRIATPTAAAAARAMFMDPAGHCYWWLRTPGQHQTYAVTVTLEGRVHHMGHSAEEDGFGVRPAMWVMSA